MEELYIEGVAVHGGPEPCVVAREGGDEASVGVRVGWAIEPRNWLQSRCRRRVYWRKATSLAALSQAASGTVKAGPGIECGEGDGRGDGFQHRRLHPRRVRAGDGRRGRRRRGRLAAPRVGNVYVTILEGRRPWIRVRRFSSGPRRSTGRAARWVTVCPCGSATVLAPMRIVGRGVFPRFAAYQLSDRTGLGVWAAFTLRGLGQLLPEGDAPDFVQFGLVSFKPGVDHAGRQRRVCARRRRCATSRAHSLRHRLRPSDIVGYESVDHIPLVLAGLLALLAVVVRERDDACSS